MRALTANDGRGQCLALDAVTPRVEWDPAREETAALIADVKAHGMQKPILCYYMTARQYEAHVAEKPHKRSGYLRSDSVRSDGAVLVIDVGNQRYAAAKALGYTHISALVFETLRELKRCA